LPAAVVADLELVRLLLFIALAAAVVVVAPTVT
jgi:hypothetical protein